MKKGLAFLVTVTILISGFAGYNLVAHAEGWLPYAKEIELDTTYVDGLSQTDCHINDYEVCDVFKFSVPEKGSITLSMESENDYYLDESELRIYNVNDPDHYVWNKRGISYEYSSARAVYFGEEDISLKQGNYYLVIEGYAEEADYSLTLGYFPAIGAPRMTKLSRYSVGTGAGLRVIWGKVARADGYYVEVSTSSKFRESKTQTFDVGKDVRSYIISGLKHKKKYYVRVKAYCILTVADVTWRYNSFPSEVWSIKTK